MLKPEFRTVVYDGRGMPSWKCPKCKKRYKNKVLCKSHILNTHLKVIKSE